MILRLSKKAESDYTKLPHPIQKKADKKFALLIMNYRYPSLRARKMSGRESFEARIDLNYRFTFQIEGDVIYILTIGPHDEGLGKK